MAKKEKTEEMSFLDHLEELRWHLIRSTLAVVIIATLAFLMKDFIFDTILFGPKKADFPTYRLFCKIAQGLNMDESFCDGPQFRIQSRQMAGQFSAHIMTSIWAGFIIGFPYLLFELWKFISPGLYENERKNAKGFILIASLLFFTGVLFGYYVVSPLSINFLANYQVSSEVFNDIDLSSYIGIIRSAVVACGLVFELPIIIFFLTKIGLVTPEILRKYRKFALVLVLIISAIITPPDVTSQIVVSIPVLILYEVSIHISRIVIKRDKKKEQTDKLTTNG